MVSKFDPFAWRDFTTWAGWCGFLGGVAALIPHPYAGYARDFLLGLAALILASFTHTSKPAE